MGFFSWDCEVCGHPLLSVYALEDKNAWMNNVVILTEEGHKFSGAYDGYGSVDDWQEPFEDGTCECYHKLCWEKAGKPTRFTEASEMSDDQGFFFAPEVHNIPEPN